jgi:hypothetical protein
MHGKRRTLGVPGQLSRPDRLQPEMGDRLVKIRLKKEGPCQVK